MIMLHTVAESAIAPIAGRPEDADLTDFEGGDEAQLAQQMASTLDHYI